MNYTPDITKHGGLRKAANIRDNIAALREWAERRNINDPEAPTLAVQVESDAVILLELGDDSPSPSRVARFPLRDGYWGLQWLRGDGTTWSDYESGGRYLTLAIPMLLMEEDVDGCFWG